MSKKTNRGSYYLETIIALGIVSLIATSLLPLLPQLVAATIKTSLRTKLVMIAEYSGEYLMRWANFNPQNKHKQINVFADGEELDLSGELRINHLPWADALSGLETLSDHYKASITFWETAIRDNSAVVRILVWYDENLDDICNTAETSYSFSTIISEKRE